MRLRALLLAMTVALTVLPVGAAQAHHRLEHPAGDGEKVFCYGKQLTKPEHEGTDDPDGDILIGTSGDDVLVGWGGDDIIRGMGGDDRICAMGGDDQVEGGAGTDYIFGGDGIDILEGGEGEDYLVGGRANDDIIGGDIIGGEPVGGVMVGGDLVDGCGAGGPCNDEVWYYDAPVPATGQYGVHLDLTRTPQTAIATHGTDTLRGIESAHGSSHPDKLVGDGGHNTFDGTPGADILEGGDGHDKLSGGLGMDRLYGGLGNDGLNGNTDDDSLYGGEGKDRLEGEEHDDHMEGGPGFDYLDYLCNSANDFCPTMNLDSGTWTPNRLTTGQTVDLDVVAASAVGPRGSTGGSGNDTFNGVEGVRGTRFDDTLLGREVHVAEVGDTEVYGDYFWPGYGNDDVDGRGGPDYVEYTDYYEDKQDNCTGPTRGSDGIFLTLVSDPAPGVFEVRGYQGDDNLTAIEHAIGTARQDVMIGSDENNDMWGGCGNDRIFGGGGNDILVGHEGDDVVDGELGDDRLAGGAGDDALHGRDGRDLISFDGLERDGGSEGVTVHLGSGTAQGEGEDGITGAEIILGSDYDDTLVGSSAPNILIGGAGADELWGRGNADRLVAYGVTLAREDEALAADGTDVLHGGGGVDTADYSLAEQKTSPEGTAVWTVDVNLRPPVDESFGRATEGSTTDLLSSVEAVQGSAFNDRLIGSAARNYLLGGPGNDSLQGGGGPDYLDGQRGDDAYVGGPGPNDTVDFGDAANTSVVVDLHAGTAAVVDDAGAVNETLSGVEFVAGTAGADRMYGHRRGGDYLAGEAGNDKTYGRGGNDSLFGGDGNDGLVGGDGDDALAGGGGTDTFNGGSGSNTCFPTVGECAGGSDPTAEGGWYHDNVASARLFFNTGDDEFLSSLDDILEDLRRLHRRRLHR